MEKIKLKKRLLEDMEDNYVPARTRTFKLKERAPIEAIEPKEEAPNLAPKVPPAAGEDINDAEGLERAYEQGDAYAHGDTLYIAGSHTAKDWFDDFTKVPFWGDTRNATRYQEAEKALKANPNIKNVVGHSLGGSVALELQKQHPNLTSRTFGAPVWDPFGEDNKYKGFGPQDSLGRGQVDRYRNVFDPVSMFDGSAKNSIKGNPFDSKSLTHDYSNIANKFQAGGADHAYGWQNPDGTTSLIE